MLPGGARRVCFHQKPPPLTPGRAPAAIQAGNVPIPHPRALRSGGRARQESFPRQVEPSGWDGPFWHGTGVVNTQHMLAWKLIIIFGSHQLLVIGSPFAGSSRVEIPPLPGSDETDPGKGGGSVRPAPPGWARVGTGIPCGKPGRGAEGADPTWMGRAALKSWNGSGGKRL